MRYGQSGVCYPYQYLIPILGGKPIDKWKVAPLLLMCLPIIHNQTHRRAIGAEENKMKKYFYFLFVALFATMSFVFTSCGDGDDEPNDPTTGKMELTIDGQKYVFGNPMANVHGNQYFCLISNNDCQLGFLILDWDDVATGTALTDENFELNWSTEEAIIGMPTSSTAVKVTDKDSKNVTISFNNAKFEDMMGYESFTVNGTITLPID